jgi:multiple antibiotic resistance protein
MLSQYFAIVARLFFLLTPFFVLSIFLTMTSSMEAAEKRRTAVRTSISSAFICLFVYFFGNFFFSFLGITLDAFRVGAGLILLLNAIELINGKSKAPEAGNTDISVVPLSVPVTIGPGTIGALLLLGTDSSTFIVKIVDCAGVLTGVFILSLMLYFSDRVEKFLGGRNLVILGKLTGLVISTLAMQMIFTGIVNFFNISEILELLRGNAASLATGG